MAILIFSHELHWRLNFVTVSGTERTWRGDLMEFFFLFFFKELCTEIPLVVT